MKQKLTELKGDMDSSSIIIRIVNTPLIIMDTKTRQKKIEDLNNTVYQIDTYRILNPTIVYTFFSNAHETFWIGHILGHNLVSKDFKRYISHKVSFLTTRG